MVKFVNPSAHMQIQIPRLIFITFCFTFLQLSSLHLRGQDLIVTFSGDSLNVKIQSILSDKLIYEQDNETRSISSREVKDFQRNYYADANVGRAGTAGQRRKESLKLHVGGFYAWSYRLAPIPSNVNSFVREFLKELKSGSSYGFSLGVFVDDQVAIGFSVNRHHSMVEFKNVLYSNKDTSIIGSLKNDVTINYYGPAVYYAFSDRAENVNFLLGMSLGYTTFEDRGRTAVLLDSINKRYGMSDYILEGSTVGLGLSFSADFKIEEHITIGPYIDLHTGVITDYIYTDISGTQYWRSTSGVPSESLSRISLGGNLRLYF